MKNRAAVATLVVFRRLGRLGKRLLLWPVLCCAVSATAQTADSLFLLLKNAPADTHRVSLLTDYAWEINESETDRAENHIREAIALAQKLKFKAGEATAWNGLGVVEENRGRYDKAIEQYEKALALRQSLNDSGGAARVLANIGNAYESLGNRPEALKRHRENLAISQAMGDTLRMARALTNISSVLSAGSAYQEAFEELNKARILVENKGNLDLTYSIYSQIGHNRFDLDMFDNARNWYEKSLNLRRMTGDSIEIADGLVDFGNALDEMGSERKNLAYSDSAVQYYQQALAIYRTFDESPSIANLCNNLADALKHLNRNQEALRYLRESEQILTELGDEIELMRTYNTLNDVLARLGKPRESLQYIDRYYAIAQRIGDKNSIVGALKDYGRAYADIGDYAKAYEFAERYNEERFKLLDVERAQNIETGMANTLVKENELALEREKSTNAIKEAELAQGRTFRNALMGGAVLLLLLAGLLLNRNRLRARANRLLTAKNETIERERQRADTLLQNILPEQTAEELKTHGVVKPVHYESVTVLFSDFKNFTTIAESMSPEALVKELDEYFRAFDAIVSRHGLEKIKTIGDAYMCAGGLPKANETHARDTVSAALEMQQVIRALARAKASAGKPFFDMRIGIHTGAVVAGVVGSHKFAYDIWGDTVNTAARMEQSGEPGKINISEKTWERVRDEFRCTFRGKLPAKNKGEIEMYFVEQE